MIRKPGYSIEHNSWFIPLTQGAIALVDADMVPVLAQHNWRAVRPRRAWYALRTAGVSKIYMHRLIVEAPNGMDVDHITHMGRNIRIIDNRRFNLRVCTHVQNSCNARPRSGASSKYKGVSWDNARQKWRADIKDRYGKRRIGRFDEELVAARAYDDVARESFGDFAWTNFPVRPVTITEVKDDE